MSEFIPKDTTLEAYQHLAQVWRRMGFVGRLRASFEAGENLRQLAASGVRMRHSDYSADQVRLAVIKLMLGKEMFKKVLPNVEIEP